MLVLIVSDNPLFKEVISEIITNVRARIMELNFKETTNRLCEIRPDVIVIDETVTPPYFDNLLTEARNLPKTRVVVLNPQQNEITLLDSHRVILNSLDDLIDTINI